MGKLERASGLGLGLISRLRLALRPSLALTLASPLRLPPLETTQGDRVLDSDIAREAVEGTTVDDPEDPEFERFELTARLKRSFDVPPLVFEVAPVISRFGSPIPKPTFPATLSSLCFNLAGIRTPGTGELRRTSSSNILARPVLEALDIIPPLGSRGEGDTIVENTAGDEGEAGTVGKPGVELDVLALAPDTWRVAGVR